MNDIIKPLTPDGMVGWDQHGQLWLWKVDGKGTIGTIIGDPRGHRCRICQQGWVLTVESLEDQRWCQYHREWTHLSCQIRYEGLKERDMWFGALVGAGIRFAGLDEIPNEYWVRDPWFSKRPWYRVRLLDSKRTLKLGRRKRVYSMEIEPGEGICSATTAEELFKTEEVTKQICASNVMIHAWSDEKAHEYLKAFAKILWLDKKAEEALK